MGRLSNNESGLSEPVVLIDIMGKLIGRFTRKAFPKKKKKKKKGEEVKIFTFRSLSEVEAR